MGHGGHHGGHRGHRRRRHGQGWFGRLMWGLAALVFLGHCI